MKSRQLLAISLLAIASGCEGHQSPTAPAAKSVARDPSAILSDGAHGGNPDFFFLPPLVPPPFNNPNFELGKFNNALQPSLTIQICELAAEPSNALPTATTACAASPLKTFAPGSVQLVNLPLQNWGWWSAYSLPPDGFYYVLWDTRASGLNTSKYYRIKVFLAGSTVPIGYADVDPMANLREWKFSLTGDVIQLVNGWWLPIAFRVENGALCAGAISCTSETVSNTNPGGEKVVRLLGNDGLPVAGAKFPDGWLPSTGPQSVVVTISSVNTGPDNADRTEGTPCHADLPLQQFRSCFKFTTTPELARNDVGRQFAKDITVAVCYILQDSEDPREKFAELYSSGPHETTHALRDVSDVGILDATGRNCGTNRYAVRSSNPLMLLASAGWGKLKSGFDRMFGVETAYAIDLGLGGLGGGLSNIGPAVTAQMQAYTPAAVTLPLGATTVIPRVQIVGSNHHGVAEGSNPLNGLPVTFAVTSGNGMLQASPTGGLLAQVTVTTSRFIYITDLTGFVDGISSVIWTPPTTPGTYTMTATGPVLGGGKTFTVTVPAATLTALAGTWFNDNSATPNVVSLHINVDGSVVSVTANGQCAPTPCDWGTSLGGISNWVTDQQITAVWDQGFAIKTLTITYLSATHLRVVTHSAFAPGDGRADYTITEYFTLST